MCRFFSLRSINGKLYYFNWEQRQAILWQDLRLPSGQTVMDADSHSEIAALYGIDPDKSNSYEYDFFTKTLRADTINIHYDFTSVLTQCRKLSVKDIVKPLIMKKIINPFKVKKYKVSLAEAIAIWKKFSKNVYPKNGTNKLQIALNMIKHIAGGEVWCAVKDAIISKITGEEPGTSDIRYEIWHAICIYTLTFFDLEYKYDFTPIIRLWKSGYAPGSDGKNLYIFGHNERPLWMEGKNER